eukprot:4352100-Amphidinium_carterae.4
MPDSAQTCARYSRRFIKNQRQGSDSETETRLTNQSTCAGVRYGPGTESRRASKLDLEEATRRGASPPLD